MFNTFNFRFSYELDVLFCELGISKCNVMLNTLILGLVMNLRLLFDSSDLKMIESHIFKCLKLIQSTCRFLFLRLSY